MFSIQKQKVYSLSDVELIQAAVQSFAWSGFNTLTLTEYERKFLSEISNIWARYGSVTWKQRKLLRELVLQVGEELERRQFVAELKTEMQD